MEYFLIIYFAIMIALVFILYKLVKSIIKAIMIVSLISLIIIGIWGFFIYNDLNIWGQNLKDTNIGVVLTENKSIAMTFEIVFKNQSVEQMKSEKTNIIKNAFSTDNYSALSNNKIFKVISFDLNAINKDNKSIELTQTIDGKNITLKMTKQQLVNVLKSNNPKEELKKINKNFDLTNADVDDTTVKAFLFAQSINALDNNDKFDLFSTIKIKPDDTITKTIEIIPWSFVKGTVLKNAVNLTK